MNKGSGCRVKVTRGVDHRHTGAAVCRSAGAPAPGPYPGTAGSRGVAAGEPGAGGDADAVPSVDGVLDQLTLAEFINSGAYDRHVRRRRLAYRRRRDHLVDAVTAGQVEGISAGLHAIVGLPPGMSEGDAAIAAAARGLALEGFDTYRIGLAVHPPAFVIGYATPPDHAYLSAVAVLRKVVQQGTASQP